MHVSWFCLVLFSYCMHMVVNIREKYEFVHVFKFQLSINVYTNSNSLRIETDFFSRAVFSRADLVARVDATFFNSFDLSGFGQVSMHL